MPREVEYHLRALFAALSFATAIAVYHSEYREQFWHHYTLTVFLCYIGSLVMLYWRGPTNTVPEIIQPLAELFRTVIEKLTTKNGAKDK